MASAEPYRCHICGHQIARSATHLLSAGHLGVTCLQCSEKSATHAQMFPGCPHSWHRVTDHHPTHATRAGARWWFARQAAHA
ncbi:hypothetical protein [Mycolicibacterium frederiksbergense]|uniref:hypothetical protein n=1 Tax=Mycolicibacterium frederiksbergense TaxID=117567 RepID=UPI00265C00AF|nr:hypothetical protein [Mycolicibacterium frederiksbergense]MDO0976020.1 hypothetical protein [Mycolicibacterium frederiksbergense]